MIVEAVERARENRTVKSVFRGTGMWIVAIAIKMITIKTEISHLSFHRNGRFVVSVVIRSRLLDCLFQTFKMFSLNQHLGLIVGFPSTSTLILL